MKQLFQKNSSTMSLSNSSSIPYMYIYMLQVKPRGIPDSFCLLAPEDEENWESTYNRLKNSTWNQI